MKAMPLPFEAFQGKGFALDFSSSSSSSETPKSPRQSHKWVTQKEQAKNCYVGCEPTSVLDTRRSPSPPTSSSTTTLSSSLNAVATALSADKPPLSESPEDLLLDKHHKCGLGIMDDWESVLSDSSPGQEQSILRLIMADVDDPSLGLNKLLQPGDVHEFNAGFGVVDDDDHHRDHSHHHVGYGGFDSLDHSSPSVFGSGNNGGGLLPVSFSPAAMFQQQQQQQQAIESFNSQLLMNQNQAQFGGQSNSPGGFLMPLSYAQLQHHDHHVQNQAVSPPPAKRLNSGAVAPPNFNVQKAHFLYAQQQQQQQQQNQQLQLLAHHHMTQPRPNTNNNSSAAVPKPKSGVGTAGEDQLAMVQQAIADQLSKAAELIETGSNPILAQGILARLNHQLTPLGNKPLHRASFYFKEALQLLINNSNNNSMSFSPFNLIFKIGAYKTFSEISPVLQFSNFTSNQAILEATEGFPRIHLVDFDIGYGGQWASFMQELAIRNNANGTIVSLKITAFASPSTHDDFELGFTQENLKHFAAELNLPFDLEILSLDALNSGASWPPTMTNEAVAINLPVASFASNNPMSLPLALRFSKQLSPKILVALERGCDRTDAPFPLQVAHGLGAFAALLESLDAVNAGPDAVQKIERSLIQPSIEKMVLGARRSCPGERPLPPWRGLVSSAGFSPSGFSNFAESQGECLVQRTPARGFHVEKRQSSLVLCWQRKELVSLSAWRC